MDGRQYAGVTHARLRKAAQGAGPSAKWVQCRRWVTVGGRVMAECEPVSDAGGWTKADKFARHIAAANPAAVLAMLARIDQLEAERADLLAMLEQARQQLAAAASTADTVAREAVTFMNQRDQLEQWLAQLERLTGVYIPRGQELRREDHPELFKALQEQQPTPLRLPDLRGQFVKGGQP